MSIEDNILIEKYLNNLLSDDEKRVFEERLNADIEFYNEFLLEKQLISTLNSKNWKILDDDSKELDKYKNALEEDDLKSLNKTLSEIGNDFTHMSKKRTGLWYYAAAASIVVLLSLQFLFNDSDSNIDLYYDNVGLSDLPSFTTRNTLDSIQLKLGDGELKFKSGNYGEALRILKPLLTEQNTNNLLYIYIGLAQTELGLYQESENTFNTLENSSNNFSANWYKALLFIKQEKIDSALEQLDIILEHSNSLYFAKASELSESLKSNN
ncbi:M48 family metallopeptidase [uncultured Winogradskyella sp.]|uniref:tetratricopeptide repeat protein n=1 Tax=uncultured Winogradskyella sp. TaxID=395353 RepID=UPI002617FCEA|nr:hypothetical protein [uncultured Winogradskyella sp.]